MAAERIVGLPQPSGLLSRTSWGLAVLRYSAVLAAVALTTVIATWLVPANASTVGFVYLLVVLLAAVYAGLGESITASLVSVLCYNFFFLPPVGSFTIADSQNWVALAAFLITAIVSSQLSVRAKQQAQEAVRRQQELERLYAFSRAVLLLDPKERIGSQLARHIATVFNCPAVALYDAQHDQVAYGTEEELPDLLPELRRAASHGTITRQPGTDVVVAAISLGGHPIGSVAMRSLALPDAALQSLLTLVAVGLERARTQEAANRAEAVRQSGELKATLLDAIAHEFKTPLTSIKAAASGLLSAPATTPARQGAMQRELATIVDEEADRLDYLVTGALETARWEAGKLHLHLRLCRPEKLLADAVERGGARLMEHPLETRIEPGLPAVSADPDMLALALHQLLDNAAKFSPAQSPITIAAASEGASVRFTFQDQGPGISLSDQAHVFDKFFRADSVAHQVPGTGMGLALVQEIARLHHGTVQVQSQPGQGACFHLLLPATVEPQA